MLRELQKGHASRTGTLLLCAWLECLVLHVLVHLAHPSQVVRLRVYRVLLPAPAMRAAVQLRISFVRVIDFRCEWRGVVEVVAVIPREKAIPEGAHTHLL